MTEAKFNREVRRGRIFPEVQWTEEQKAKRTAEREAFYQRCKPIFDANQPALIKKYYKWYMAVEPESGEYFVAQDEMSAIKISRQRYPHAPILLFQINETGVSGTI